MKSRSSDEEELQAAVAEAWEEYHEAAAEAIQGGTEFDYGGYAAALTAAILPLLAGFAAAQALEVAKEVGVPFDPVDVQALALDWATTYSYELVSGITETTRELIAEATAAFIETPGMTMGQLYELLKPTFGPVRARLIGITETTRAYAQATNQMQAMLRARGVETTRVWHTSGSDVCEVCAALDGEPEDVWIEEFPNGPPDPHPG